MRQFRAFAAGAVILGASALYMACVSDDPSTQSGTSGNDASTGGNDGAAPINDSGLAGDAAPSLGCPLGCLPPAPSGWTGPSAVYDGPPETKPAACPSTYTQKEVEAFQGMDAGAALCSCGSPTFAGANCNASVVAYPTAACSGSGALLEGSFNSSGASTCLTIGNDGYIKVPAASISPGTCSFVSPTTTLPDAGFASEELSCGLPQNAACANSTTCVATPVPDAPFTRLCIHQDGDVACPSADYAQRFVANKNIDDERSCGACIGTASGGTCGTSWGISGSVAGCQATTPSGMTTGTCTTSEQGIGAVIGGNIAPSGMSCLRDGGAPDGSVLATDPVTFCCNK